MSRQVDNLEDARNAIDQVFGKGYTKNHPDLLGQFIQSEAIDRLAATVDRAAYGVQVAPQGSEPYPGALEMIAIALGVKDCDGILGALNGIKALMEEVVINLPR